MARNCNRQRSSNAGAYVNVCVSGGRDKVCGGGRVLKSPALKYSIADLNTEMQQDADTRVDEDVAMDTTDSVQQDMKVCF